MSQFPTCEHGLMLNDVYPCEKCEKNRAEKQRLTSLARAVNENYEARIAALEAERDHLVVAAKRAHGALMDDEPDNARAILWDALFGDESEKAELIHFVFGLKAQGHIPTIEQALAESKTWEEIGKLINWCPKTAEEHYRWYLEDEAGKEG